MWQGGLSQLLARSLPLPSHTLAKGTGLANMHETPRPSRPSLTHDPTNSCSLGPLRLVHTGDAILPRGLGPWRTPARAQEVGRRLSGRGFLDLSTYGLIQRGSDLRMDTSLNLPDSSPQVWLGQKKAQVQSGAGAFFPGSGLCPRARCSTHIIRRQGLGGVTPPESGPGGGDRTCSEFSLSPTPILSASKPGWSWRLGQRQGSCPAISVPGASCSPWRLFGRSD